MQQIRVAVDRPSEGGTLPPGPGHKGIPESNACGEPQLNGARLRTSGIHRGIAMGGGGPMGMDTHGEAPLPDPLSRGKPGGR